MYNVFQRKAAAGALNFLPGTVRDIAFDGSTPVLTASLIVQNTSSQQFILKAIAGDLYSNGYWVGNISYWQPQTIAATRQTEIRLQIRLGLIGIVQDIINAFQYNNTTQVLKFVANANVDNIQVPIDIKYKIGL